jgi:hypothetical protein
VETKLAFYRLIYYLLEPKVKSGMNYWRFYINKELKLAEGFKSGYPF